MLQFIDNIVLWGPYVGAATSPAGPWPSCCPPMLLSKGLNPSSSVGTPKDLSLDSYVRMRSLCACKKEDMLSPRIRVLFKIFSSLFLSCSQFVSRKTVIRIFSCKVNARSSLAPSFHCLWANGYQVILRALADAPSFYCLRANRYEVILSALHPRHFLSMQGNASFLTWVQLAFCMAAHLNRLWSGAQVDVRFSPFGHSRGFLQLACPFGQVNIH